MSTRRHFLQQSAVAVALTACTKGGRQPLGQPEISSTSRAQTAVPGLRAASPELHLLKRATFGPTPADLEQLRNRGAPQWLEWQLNADAIDDSAVNTEVNQRWPTLGKTGCELAGMNDDNSIMRELRDATLFRRIFSQRQLYEVMVDFWSDHFTIYHGAGIAQHMKTVDDREVVRAHALGNFRAMLHASARSPAMLEYLDNRRSEAGRINENYARELLELHTLGVDGGYTETDIVEVARALTGWRVISDTNDPGCVNNKHRSFEFRMGLHDQDEKIVLGTRLAPGRGIEDGNDVLDLLVDHPATARFISRKLYRRFVSDATPPSAWVETVATAWGADGEIPALLRAVFQSDEFAQSADKKMSRPQDFAIAAIRALQPEIASGGDAVSLLGSGETPSLYQSNSLMSFAAADEAAHESRAYEGPDTRNYLIRTGHVPFQWPSPDGYPMAEEHWASVNGAAQRWQFALQAARAKREDGTSNATFLAGDTQDAASAVDRLSASLLMRELDADTYERIVATAQIGPGGGQAGPEQMRRRAMGLLLASPYAQRR